jgi:type II secretory pathway pseudopilin PulG
VTPRRRPRRRPTVIGARQGASLLEVLVGLTLLAVAGAALLSLLAQTIDAVSRQHRYDAQVRTASARLDAIAVWTRAQLEARVGTTPLGPWTLRIAMAPGGLYHVSLSADDTPGVFLETSLYRPEPSE